MVAFVEGTIVSDGSNTPVVATILLENDWLSVRDSVVKINDGDTPLETSGDADTAIVTSNELSVGVNTKLEVGTSIVSVITGVGSSEPGVVRVSETDSEILEVRLSENCTTTLGIDVLNITVNDGDSANTVVVSIVKLGVKTSKLKLEVAKEVSTTANEEISAVELILVWVGTKVCVGVGKADKLGDKSETEVIRLGVASVTENDSALLDDTTTVGVGVLCTSSEENGERKVADTTVEVATVSKISMLSVLVGSIKVEVCTCSEDD